jgi:hypothetical protein
VETTGDLVAASLFIELSTRVQGRKDDLHSGLSGSLDDIDGDPASVVRDPAPTVGEELDDDPVAIPGHRFIHGVVHDLVDEVMETSDAGGADVHPRPFPDRVETL